MLRGTYAGAVVVQRGAHFYYILADHKVLFAVAVLFYCASIYTYIHALDDIFLPPVFLQHEATTYLPVAVLMSISFFAFIYFPFPAKILPISQLFRLVFKHSFLFFCFFFFHFIRKQSPSLFDLAVYLYFIPVKRLFRGVWKESIFSLSLAFAAADLCTRVKNMYRRWYCRSRVARVYTDDDDDDEQTQAARLRFNAVAVTICLWSAVLLLR